MIGVTGYPIEPLNELIEKSKVKIDMVLCYTRGSMADQKLNQFLPGWKEKNIFVVNASPLGMGLFRRGGPQPWHPANDDLKVPIIRLSNKWITNDNFQEEIKKCITLCEEKNIDISRLALRYALDSIQADIVLCGTAKTVELDENIKNTLTPLTSEEQAVQDEILSRLAKLQGHWEGRELIAYNNRINDVEDDLPFFRQSCEKYTQMQSHPMPHGNKKESDLFATWENVTDYMHNLVPARRGTFCFTRFRAIGFL